MTIPTEAVERVHTALRAHGITPRRSGTGWACRCPAHDDRNPSLSIRVGDDGRALVRCHATCTQAEVVAALGLTMRDLMPDAPSKPYAVGRLTTTPSPPPEAPRAFATPEDAIADLERRSGRVAATWTYTDADGNPVGMTLRWDRPDGKRTLPISRNGVGWVVKAMPDPRPLYNLPDLIGSPEGARVFVVEGEKAAKAALRCGLTATTSAGGAKAASKSDWSPLKGRAVVVMPDRDDPGERYAADVVRHAHAHGARSVRVVRLADAWPELPEGGDLADLTDAPDADLDTIRDKVNTLADEAAEEPPPAPGILGADGTPLLSIRTLGELGPGEPPDWLWPNYLARGAITLFVGLWKAGKTTLLAHLLRDLRRGTGLVEKPIDCGVLVLTEEPDGVWANRRDDLDLDHGVRVAKPHTLGRPTPDQWARIIGGIAEQVKAGEYGLVIIDTLAGWWPVLNENDAGEVGNAIAPLRAISEAGAAVMVVHHPRKGDGENGTATRGSGALPGFVDLIVELRRYAEGTVTQRVISALGRLDGNPDDLIIDLTDDGYAIVGGRQDAKADDARHTITALLPTGGLGMTAEEVHDAWPKGRIAPKVSRVMGYLNEGCNHGRWERSGQGVRGNPWRFRFPSPPRGESGTESNPPPDDGPEDRSDSIPSRPTLRGGTESNSTTPEGTP